MAKPTEHAQDNDREARSIRRLVHSFHSTGSYGLLMLMIVATYVLATTLTQQWGATIVLVAQIGTVWLALRTSLARRRLRGVAAVLFAAATVAAAANLFVERDSDVVAFVFLTASALYVVAPVSIVRHIGYRREVDQETMLGALCAYLLFGMAFAFAYRSLGAAQTDPFFGADGDGHIEPGSVLQPRHAHDDRVRQPRPCRQPRPEPRRARGARGPAIPRDCRREDRERLAAKRLAVPAGRRGQLR